VTPGGPRGGGGALWLGFRCDWYSLGVTPLDDWLARLGVERSEKGQSALYILYVIIAVLVIIVLLKVLGVI